MTIGAIRRLARAGRRFEITWRYVFNFAPTLSYRMRQPNVSGEASRVLSDLNRDGVAITSAAALFGFDKSFNELCTAFDELHCAHFEQLSIARADANAGLIDRKGFIYEYLGHHPELNPRDIFARFALHHRILRIANAYLGMYTRLRYFNVWHTFATTGEPRQSQLWHCDREDRYILKVFVYLSDVDEGAGPFTYAPGTHAKGAIRRTPDFFDEYGIRRTGDAQMSQVVPSDRWISCRGPRGAIVFADTRGYHKGGLARGSDRIMYTCMYTSPASESEEFLRRPTTIDVAVANREEAFAMSPPRGGLWLSLK